LKSTQTLTKDNNEDEVQDIDLTDSDDDATWTPFQNKDGKKLLTMTDLDEDAKRKVRRDHYLIRAIEISFILQLGLKKLSSPLPLPTNLVPDGCPFNVGDFMVLRTDVDRESSPIWRLDSAQLVQKYNAVQQPDGRWLHRSASLFSSYSPDSRSNYASVAVRFLRFEKGDNTVQVIQKTKSNNAVVASSNNGVGANGDP
jgi:hypothetical protein